MELKTERNEQLNLFGLSEQEELKQTLFDKFIVPPFSVLDRRQGYWQNRKRLWMKLGIRSELGRAEHLAFNINSFDAEKDKAIRHGETSEGKAPSTSVFDPVLCELAYKWFCPPMGKILDPFAGGSVRGIVASYLGFGYTGIDIRKEQIEENEKQRKEILGDMECGQLDWICDDAEHVLSTIGDNKELYDFAFTCPPYFDLEVYSDDERDLSNMNWAQFKTKYEIILQETASHLKNDSFFGIVVGDVRDKHGCFRGLPRLTQETMGKVGLELYDDFILLDPLGSASMRASGQFTASRKAVTSHQRFMVFVQGDAREATCKIKGY